MSIRDLASDLYRSEKTVEALEKKLKDPGLSREEKAETEHQLRQARLDRDRLKAMLEGAKSR